MADVSQEWYTSESDHAKFICFLGLREIKALLCFGIILLL